MQLLFIPYFTDFLILNRANSFSDLHKNSMHFLAVYFFSRCLTKFQPGETYRFSIIFQSMDLDHFQHDSGLDAVEFFSNDRLSSMKKNGNYRTMRTNKTVNITTQQGNRGTWGGN